MSRGPTRARPPSVVVRYTRARICVSRGPDAGLTLETTGMPVRIGTDGENDIVLSDDTVSRHHCEIEIVPAGVRVRDRDSTNGVMMGAMRVFDAVIPHDVVLRLGETEIAVALLDSVVRREQVAADRFGDVLGRSPRMRELFADLERIAESDVTLLIEGETGTGKDLVAESVHRTSPRSDGPFIVFDCGAITPTLVESELFGHERGAFTGAVASRLGVFEQAEGGTLFLDEIGELPKELQTKLLRALEKRQIRHVGGARTIDVDCRVIAATNRNLRAEIQRGTFREDLYFRLAGASVVVPSLRDRMEDLPLLVEHFLRVEMPAIDPSTAVPEHVWSLFRSHRWPGNVRELRNAARRLLVMPKSPLLAEPSSPVVSPSASPSVAPLRTARREASDAFERGYVAAILAAANGNVTRAASIAEVSRQMLQKLMRKHGRAERDEP